VTEPTVPSVPSVPSVPIDRRRLLAGLGGAAVVGGAVVLAGSSPAQAASPRPGRPAPGVNGQRDVGRGPLVAAAFTPTPGLRYAAVSGYGLKSWDPTSAVTDSPVSGAGPRPGGAFVTADIDIPHAAVIKELHVWGTGAVSATLEVQSYGVYVWSQVGNVSAAAGLGLQYGMAAVADYQVNRNLETCLWHASMASTDAISSLLVGYAPGLLNFVPITPARVYDSRFVSPTGPMTSGTNRTLSVANSYGPGSGVIAVHDLVPVGAGAISYNLTVTGTSGSGYLSVNPGGTPAVTSSSINWSGSVTLANGLAVALDANRQIKVFCSGGTANLIVDVLGYYV